MSDDEIARQAKLAYQKGYRAGLGRKKRKLTLEHRRAQKQAFLDRAFLAALSATIRAENWKTGDRPINNLPDRVELAARFAREALRQRPLA